MGQLLRQALSTTALRLALARVRHNDGVDGIGTAEFAAAWAHEGQALRAEVLGGRYRPAPLKRLWLPRPDKPPRPLAVPTVRDRVLQTSVAQVLGPLLEAEFEDCSFAHRAGRSVRMAVARVERLQREGYRWAIEADSSASLTEFPTIGCWRNCAGSSTTNPCWPWCGPGCKPPCKTASTSAGRH